MPPSLLTWLDLAHEGIIGRFARASASQLSSYMYWGRLDAGHEAIRRHPARLRRQLCVTNEARRSSRGNPPVSQQRSIEHPLAVGGLEATLALGRHIGWTDLMGVRPYSADVERWRDGQMVLR